MITNSVTRSKLASLSRPFIDVRQTTIVHEKSIAFLVKTSPGQNQMEKKGPYDKGT